MRVLILTAACCMVVSMQAQNNITSNIIEGSKTLVELVRVIKTPRSNMGQANITEKKDSCAIKAVSDMYLRNAMANPVIVSLYRRNGNTYETIAISVKILPKNQEALFELRAGIYKMKIETETGEVRKVLREGEMKINACENTLKEIKDNE